MKILLTGSLGFLGSRTLEKLAKQDEVEAITAAARTKREWRILKSPKIHYAYGDLRDKKYVNAIATGCHSIVHTAALSSPWGKPEAFRQSNVEVQANLLEAAQAHQVNRFIYVSTPSLYFELKDKFNISEEDPLPGKFINNYAATKHEAEALLSESGIPYITLRPRALIGRGDTIIMPRLIRAYDEGRLQVIGNGKNIADLTPVANVADAILLALTARETALNQVYNISNGNPVVLWEKIDLVLKQLGRQLPSKSKPSWLVGAVARLMELKARLTDNREPPLTIYGAGTLSHSFTLSIEKAERLLGYQPEMTVDEAIDEFTEWYKRHENG